MSNSSERFQLPFILPGQAQKELYHNEALTRIDIALNSAVEEATLVTPPGSPVAGRSWIVGSGASGAWAGKDNQVACWTESGWRFIVPQPGTTAWDKDAGHWRHFNGTGWSGDLPAARLVVAGQQVVGSRQPAVPSPSGGTIIDVEARTTLDAVIAALMSHGLID